MSKQLLAFVCLLALSMNAAAWLPVEATAFTYQGELSDENGQPLDGLYDFIFTLYDIEDPRSANQVGSQLTFEAVSVVSGRFTQILDFGAGCFESGGRYPDLHGPGEWLEIQVRRNRGTTYTTLAPLQPLTPTPYASQLKGPLPNGALEGTFSGQVNFSNSDNSFRGSFTGSGNGLVEVDAETLGGLAASSLWALGGNAATDESDYLGTTDEQPLEFIVNNQRSLKLELPPETSSPNLIVNSLANETYFGAKGSTIAGGGQPDYVYYDAGQGRMVIIPHGHRIGSDYAFIGGGYDNQIWIDGDYGVIPGGRSNVVNGAYGFAAGHKAQAQHTGAFVWADSRDAVFASTSANQFSVRASGGIRFVTDGAGITIDGQPISTGGTPTGVALLHGGNTFYDVQRFTGAVGFGIEPSGARLHLIGTAKFEGTYYGVNSPGVYASNTNDAGIALFATVESSDATVVAVNQGSGDIIKGFSGPNGGDLVFQVQNNGKTIMGNARVNGDGTGTSNPGLYVANANGSGIGIFNTVTSSDASLVAVNKGTGDIIKGYSGATGGNLAFRVNNSGYVYCQDELSCESLEIRGGADLAEPFAMSNAAIQPGSVVIIDADQPGRLTLSTQAYDSKVAGIVSGAGGVKPGISMIQEDALEGGQNVALSGRVYAMVDASWAPVKPGDLLTTSATPGHAMKVTDHTKAQGAILGKAMSRLENGKGLVLVLVSLQ